VVQVSLREHANYGASRHDREMAGPSEAHDLIGEIERVAGVERRHLLLHEVPYAQHVIVGIQAVCRSRKC
jgi:hypothetical protein